MAARVVSAAQAAAIVRSGDTILIGGSGGGHAVPEALMAALGSAFWRTASRASITAVHPVGLGDGATRGVGHFAHRGPAQARRLRHLRQFAAGLATRASPNKIEAYTLPQGALSQLMREMAAGRPGLITQTGLHTFVDPRHGGGRQSKCATEDLVELVTFARQGIAVLQAVPRRRLLPARHHRRRGRQRDDGAGGDLRRDAVDGAGDAPLRRRRHRAGQAHGQARHAAAQAGEDSRHPGRSRVVVDPDQRQTYVTDYSPAYAGELRDAAVRHSGAAARCRARSSRGAPRWSCFPAPICNLGSGISTGIANVAAEEGVLDDVC